MTGVASNPQVVAGAETRRGSPQIKYERHQPLSESLTLEASHSQERILQTQRIIPYGSDAIYAAFSDPARLALWWGPRDFKNTFQAFEFRTGGAWNYLMHGPDGQDYPNRSVFRILEDGKKIVIDHISAPRFTLSVSLQPVEGGTQVLWVQAFEDPKVAEAVRHIAEPGNEQNLDRLHLHLRGEL
ncbi:MAG TPA: SRPBCC domain-containing protein [Noviherbaspirillum sp.]